MPGISIRAIVEFLIALLVAGALEFGCHLIAGNSLNLFLSGIFVSVLLTCPVAAFTPRMPGACRRVAATAVGIGTVWLIPVFSDVIDARQWSLCMLLLVTFVAALVALALLFRRIGCSTFATNGVIMTAALLWLTWPVWLSASLPGSQLHWSVAIHPLFAINKVVANLGILTEQQGAYGLTIIGQDVQYQMPALPWPAIFFHTALAAISIFFAWLIAPRSINHKDADRNAVTK